MTCIHGCIQRRYPKFKCCSNFDSGLTHHYYIDYLDCGSSTRIFNYTVWSQKLSTQIEGGDKICVDEGGTIFTGVARKVVCGR